MPDPSFLARDRARLRHGPSEDDVAPLPGWLQGLGPRRRAPRWPAGAVAVVLAAMLAWFWLRPPPEVIVKGEPRVVVHLRGAEGSQPWDGAPLAAGDSLRLEVRGLGTPWYAVVLLEQDGPPSLLSAGPTPVDGVLPGAWTLDGPGEGHTLVVVGLDADPRGRPAGALLAEEGGVRVDLR